MEETKRRRFIIRAVLEGEVDVQEEPGPATLYPIILNADDPGVAFGLVEGNKNTNNPPYVSNSWKTRIHCIGENALGYPIEMGRSYRISVPADATVYRVQITYFNEDGVNEIESVSAVSTNLRNQSYIMTDNAVTITPLRVNGKDAKRMWMLFQKNAGGNENWSAVSDICPITIEEI